MLNYQFNYNNVSEWKPFLEEHGYVVILDILDPVQVSEVKSKLYSFLDKSEEYQKYGKFQAFCPNGILKSFGSSTCLGRAQVCSEPKTSNVFAHALGLPVKEGEVNDHLVVSLDGFSHIDKSWGKEPADPRWGNNLLRANLKNDKNPFHVDHFFGLRRNMTNDAALGFHCYQSMVAIEPQHKKTCHIRFLDGEHTERAVKERMVLGKHLWNCDPSYVTKKLQLGLNVSIELPEGGMVLWDDRLPHHPQIVSRVLSGFDPDHNKLAVYISFQPKDDYRNSSCMAKDRLQRAKDATNTCHYTFRLASAAVFPTFHIRDSDEEERSLYRNNRVNERGFEYYGIEKLFEARRNAATVSRTQAHIQQRVGKMAVKKFIPKPLPYDKEKREKAVKILLASKEKKKNKITDFFQSRENEITDTNNMIDSILDSFSK